MSSFRRRRSSCSSAEAFFFDALALARGILAAKRSPGQEKRRRIPRGGRAFLSVPPTLTDRAAALCVLIHARGAPSTAPPANRRFPGSPRAPPAASGHLRARQMASALFFSSSQNVLRDSSVLQSSVFVAFGVVSWSLMKRETLCQVSHCFPLGRVCLEPAAMPAGRLEVNVLDGTRLKDTQTFGKQDPYCVLRVGEQRDRTKTCADGGTRPRWNERFRFSLAGHESALDLEVWNANKMTSDAYIGAALVSLGDVFASGTQDAAVPLRDKKNKIAGNVMLVLRFAPDVAENANRPGDARSNPHAGLTNEPAVVRHEPPPHVVTGNPHAQPAVVPVYRPAAAAAAPAYAPRRRLRPRRSIRGTRIRRIRTASLKRCRRIKRHLPTRPCRATARTTGGSRTRGRARRPSVIRPSVIPRTRSRTVTRTGDRRRRRETTTGGFDGADVFIVV